MQTEAKKTAAPVEEPLKPPAPIETRPVQVTDLAVASSALIDDPHFDEDAMTQRFARRQQLIRLCFRMTSPSQWVTFKDERSGKATVYPMGGAADAIILHILGCMWREEKVAITKRDTNGEPLIAEATGWLVSMANEKKIGQFTGYREMGGFVKTEPDLKKGARENMKSVAVRDLLGLRGRSPEELGTLGLDLAKTGAATFANNKAGSDAVVTIPFGKLKGTPITDPKVTERELLYHVAKEEESLSDPSKAKWHAAGAKRIAAYRAEIERRKNPPKPAEDLGDGPPPDDYDPKDF